jgi:hypothetical protein
MIATFTNVDIAFGVIFVILLVLMLIAGLMGRPPKWPKDGEV